ncbi:hypothetical protein Tco_0720972 [Tanacetum coccineum]
MEDEEVATVDGVFEGALGNLVIRLDNLEKVFWCPHKFGGGSLSGCHGGDDVEGPLVDGDVEEVVDFSLESMEDEEVATVDGVFEGALGNLVIRLDNLERCLEVEALVDAMEIMVVDDECSDDELVGKIGREIIRRGRFRSGYELEPSFKHFQKMFVFWVRIAEAK